MSDEGVFVGTLGGRPLKLTEDLRENIALRIQGGAPQKAAAEACGISARSHARWMARGKALDAMDVRLDDLPDDHVERPYLEYYRRIRQALAEDESVHAMHIRMAGEKDWRASAFHLERRYPKDWGKRVILTAEMIDYESLTDEQIDRMLEGEDPEKVLGARTTV